VVLEDPTVATHEVARRLVEELGKGDAAIEVVVASERPDRVSEIDLLVDRFRAHLPDALVAVGGGRTIDAAKALRLRWRGPDLALGALPPILEVPAEPRILSVAVPTTSGSGAEASWSADVWDAEESPVEVADRSLVPDWAVVDPAFATGLSPTQVIDGAFQTLALGTEAYLSAWSNPLSDALALDAVATVLSRLAHAVRWSDDPDARAALHYAASSAGLAASNAQRGLAHALARALERPTGLRYGRLVGIALPHVLDFNHTGARERLEVLALQGRARDDRAEGSLAERVRRLADQVRFPATVLAAGGNLDRTRPDLDRVVRETRRSPGSLANPRVPTEPELRELLTAVLGR
jgi:alcohol dehydrogenase class IV